MVTLQKTGEIMLAIDGGKPCITKKFKPYLTIGKEEIQAVVNVMESGNLSQFIGAWCEDFYGGPVVRKFETEWAKFFGVKHAIAVNSWTSGLTASIGAIGIEPGDEVIVSPWTMAASATAILHWNAIPVFVDISREDFCLDVKQTEKAITEFTKAIMIVDIFGQSADMDAFRALARKYNLKLITDCAQAPGAIYKNELAGTLSDIGGFSLNYHKHIHTGEGGVIVTDDPNLAERARLIRNHAEAVVGDKKETNLSNMVGYNFRMGEIEAAIGLEQLRKLPTLLKSRQSIGTLLSKKLSNVPGLHVTPPMPGRDSAYYVLPLILDLEKLSVARNVIFNALIAEGVEGISEGYTSLHLLPMYQKKIAYGSKGFPWIPGIANRDYDYSEGICPVAEELHSFSFIGFEVCKFDLSEDDIESIVLAFTKVLTHFLK
jgi:dTDP-4-amino-4,6-dideoxygalactose transaminase